MIKINFARKKLNLPEKEAGQHSSWLGLNLPEKVTFSSDCSIGALGFSFDVTVCWWDFSTVLADVVEDSDFDDRVCFVSSSC